MESTVSSHRLVASGIGLYVRTLLAWREIARQRSRLMDLDDHLLDDIGLTRHQAADEAERPAWDAPGHWQR